MALHYFSRWRSLITLTALLVNALGSTAQPLPAAKDKFPEAVKARLAKLTEHPEAAQAADLLLVAWYDRRFDVPTQERISTQANTLLSKRFALYPDVFAYVSTVARLADPNTLKLSGRQAPLREYLDLVDSSLALYPPTAVHTVLVNTEKLFRLGTVPRTGDYYWRLSNFTAHLGITRLYDAALEGTLEFPGITFAPVTISIYRHTDSLFIDKAAGKLDLGTLTFRGNQGRYGWLGTEYGSEACYATLQSFFIDIKQDGFRADTATLYFKGVLPAGVQGSIKDPLLRNPVKQRSEYPQFRSFKGGLNFMDPPRKLDYVGGFGLKGLRRFCIATPEAKAAMYLKRAGNVRALRLEGDELPVGDSTLHIPSNAVTVLLPNGDSLAHPSLVFDFNDKDGSLVLSKDAHNPYAKQPMTSSYHHYDLYFDALRWNPQTDSMVFSALIAQDVRTGAVESADYFQSQRFNQLKGVLTFNPLGLLYSYVLKRKEDRLKAKKNPPPIPVTDTTPVDIYGNPIAPDPALDVPLTEDTDLTDELTDGGDPSASTTKPPEKPSATNKKKPLFAPVEIDSFLRAYKVLDQKEAFLQAVPQLAANGFILYNQQRNQVTLLPRLVTWAKAARKAKDYDVIQLISLTQAYDNADLNLKTGILRVNGVESFVLSDSQRVRIRPQDQQVNAGQDRNLRFGGLIYVGKANLYGKGLDKFQFDYKNFKVDCAKLDSVKFIPERDRSFNPDKNPRLAQALQQLRIQDVNGAVYVNKPNNKSGIKKATNYPVFDCFTKSYVYWSGTNVQKGVYKRTRLNFALDPFLLDSLDKFVLDNLEFYGEMNTGNIFPTFRDTLKPVSDNTYGIHQKFAAPGVNIYRGKGQFTNELQMDGFALHGKGNIAYRGTITRSDTFIFHFDSVMAYTTSFYMPEGSREGVFYPNMAAGRLEYKWYPKQDVVHLQTLQEPLALYNGSAFFSGVVNITKKGVFGNGRVVSGNMEISSDSINLSNLVITSSGSTFRVADATDSTVYHFVVQNANVTLNVKARHAAFQTAIPGKAQMSFPIQRYATSLSTGEYDETKQLVSLSSKYPEPKFNFFISQDSNQYGLRFPAKTATYLNTQRQIEVAGADSFIVGDALLIPNGAKLTVQPDGKLAKFTEARMIADTLRRYHDLSHVNVEVLSRRKFTGEGAYVYRTRGVGDQAVKLGTLVSLTDLTTYGRGVIKADQNFFISDRIYFRDSVTLKSRNKFLGFSGEVRIQSKNPIFADAWFAFRDTLVNPDTVIVPIAQQNLRNKKTGNQLVVGVENIPQRRLFYSNFFQEKRDKKDVEVLLGYGALTYDRENRQFRVGPPLKLKGEQYRGNVVAYDDELRITTSQGKFAFPTHFPPEGGAALGMSGSWRHDEVAKEVLTNMLLWLDLPGLPEAALSELYNRFKLFTLNSSDVNYQNNLLIESIAEYLDVDTIATAEPNTRTFVAGIGTGPRTEQKLARDIPASFLFSDVKLSYNDTIRGFFTSLPVGIIGIGGKPLNKMVDVRLDYRFGKVLPNGVSVTDTLKLYMQTDELSWVYFWLQGTELRTISSEPSYNNIIAAAADKGTGKKGDKGPAELTLVKIEEADKVRFLRSFAKYLYR